MLALAVVEAFLKDTIEAFLARDGARIAAFYNAPCVTMRADGSIHAFTSQEDIREFFQRFADTGTRSVLATMDWEMRREDGNAIRRWRQSYNLVVADGRPRLLASTIHLT